MKSYLIKRNSDYSEKNQIRKRNNKNKGFSEKIITSSSRMPASNKFEIGDMIYVAETKYGIWSKGEISEISQVVELNNTSEVVQYINSTRRKDDSRWLQTIKELEIKKKKNERIVFKFQEYRINQKLLIKVIPLIGKLSRLSKPGMAASVIMLNDKEVEFLKNPILKSVNELKPKIPSRLKLELYNLFNTKMTVSHWIDIDHFVPMSSGGPGNIIENLVPVGFSLNRYKSDSIPTGLFKIASEIPSLKKFCKKVFLERHPGYLRKKNYSSAFDNAQKINDLIKKLKIEEAKEIYIRILKEHHPEYVEIISKLRDK